MPLKSTKVTYRSHKNFTNDAFKEDVNIPNIHESPIIGSNIVIF